ncbi:MAG: diacylglycerol kinase family protein [Oscillospiraceae bacterium]|nr:diacylglycerol kinase family protein [Oscillospiraceae bacterium]
MKKCRKGGFLKSFGYAARGVLYAIRNERNFRVHLCVTLYVLVFSIIGAPPRDDVARLFLCIGLVMSAELVNTALEKMCDTVTEEKNEKIKIAKDTAAGAVLISAIMATVVGLITFLNPPVFNRVVKTLSDMPYIAALIIISIPLAVWFIVGRKKK